MERQYLQGIFSTCSKYKNVLSRKALKHKDVMKLIKDKNLFEHHNLMQFLKENQEIYTVNTLSMIAEYQMLQRKILLIIQIKCYCTTFILYYQNLKIIRKFVY